MKRVLLFILFCLLVSSFVFSRRIEVTNPRGGDKWCIGGTHTIQWTTPVSPNRRVRILILGADRSKHIVDKDKLIKNSGSYSWRVPDTFKPGDYKIRVIIQGARIQDIGDLFTIHSCLPCVPGKAGNPGPEQGSTGVDVNVDLSWKAGANAAYHCIYFGSPEKLTFWGTQEAPNNTFDPGTLNYDTTYCWRIDEKGEGGTITGTVWRFTTKPVPPPIAVNIPKKDRAYRIGGQIPISWTTGTEISGDVKINLIPDDAPAKPIVVSERRPHDGSPAYYTVPPEVTPGNYSVEIAQVGVSEPKSAKSGSFKITSLPPPTHLFALPKNIKSTYKIYLGWRLDSSNPRVGYNVYREGPEDEEYVNLNAVPIKNSTNYEDAAGIQRGAGYSYYVCAVDPDSGRESGHSNVVKVTAGKRMNVYKMIPNIATNTAKADVKVGDFNGDGLPDFLVVCRDFEKVLIKDPRRKKPKEKLLPKDIHIKAYDNNGGLACDINMYETERLLRTAWTLWDLNGDGKDEVIGVMKKRPGSNQYRLVVIDPTAKPSPQYKILSEVGVPSTPPHTTRFKTIAIAYLDGKRPYILYGSGHLIGQRRCVGAYSYDNEKGLKMEWVCDERPKQGIESSHQFEVADIDGDGKDEVFFGVYVYGQNGRKPGYWGGHEWPHVDGVHIGNIDPDIEGPELYFHVEQHLKPTYGGGIHVTGNNGEELWKRQDDCPKCRHAHAGWIGDVVPGTPGMEVWVIHKKVGSGMICRFLYTCKGERFKGTFDFRLGTVDWDGTGCLEVFDRGWIKRFRQNSTIQRAVLKRVRPVVPIGGGPKVVMDVIGDYREEVIGFLNHKGHLVMQIFTNTQVNNHREFSPCENRQYLQKHRWDGH
jgi:hypothetical protein